MLIAEQLYFCLNDVRQTFYCRNTKHKLRRRNTSKAWQILFWNFFFKYLEVYTKYLLRANYETK